MIRSVFAIFALYCSAALSTFAGDVHPQDGPHVDVRIKVLSNMVIIRLEMNLVFLDYALDFPREFEDRVSGMEFEELEGLLADVITDCADGAFALLALDTLLTQANELKLLRIHTFPNFMITADIDAAVHVPLFEDVLRVMAGSAPSQLSLITN